MLFDDAHEVNLDRESRVHRGSAAGETTFPALELPKRQKPIEHSWSPYNDNGGTAAAVAGKGYVVVGGDMRLNGNFNFLSRDDDSKLFQLTDKAWLASTGMQGDRLQLQQVLKHKIRWFAHNNGGRVPSTPALAQMLSGILYGRRFFPYYTFNIIAGLDEQGNGVCYSYDAVGCTEPLSYGTTGSGSAFVEPLLDCLIRRPNQANHNGEPAQLSQDEAVKMLRNAFTSAAERDCNTGDAVKFVVLSADGPKEEILELRHD